MRSTRVLTGAALSAAALGLSTTAASAGDFGSIEVSPSQAKAGSTVNLTSSACGRHGSAQVDASALGAGIVPLSSQGQTHSQNVQGSLRIPSGTKPGNYGIGGKCAHGKEITGTITVSVGTGRGMGPGTGRSMPQGKGSEASTMPQGKGSEASTMPHGKGSEASTMPHGKGSEGMGGATTASATPRGKEGATSAPKGKMKTGVGTESESSNGTEIASGAAMLMAAVAGGVWVMRRRREGGRS